MRFTWYQIVLLALMGITSVVFAIGCLYLCSEQIYTAPKVVPVVVPDAGPPWTFEYEMP